MRPSTSMGRPPATKGSNVHDFAALAASRRNRGCPTGAFAHLTRPSPPMRTSTETVAVFERMMVSWRLECLSRAAAVRQNPTKPVFRFGPQENRAHRRTKSTHTGQGAILDALYRLVDSSNPATTGSAIQIFCTGLGEVSHQPASGSAAPSGPLASTTTVPIVTIGGAAATVLFSGLTLGEVGLYQVNALIPADSTRGAGVPVTISMGSSTSNTVTIAVQ